MRRGVTILELLLALSLAGILAAFLVPASRAARDRVALDAAARELVLLLGQAREVAVARGASALHLDSADASATLRAPGTADHRAPFGVLFGVTLRATRDSLAFDARGLGRGAANLSIVLARGAAVETVVVSRLGRVRR